MVLDNLLSVHLQLRFVPGLDNLLSVSPYRDYLLACKVEDKARGTLERYATVLSEFVSFMQSQGPLPAIESITKNDVRLFFLALMQRNLAPVTRHQYYRSLKTFFNWLVDDEELLDKSPMHGIDPPIVPQKILNPFKDSDIENFLVLTSGKRFLDKRNRAIVLTFMECGIRRAEMAGIKLIDLDMKHTTIKVFGKGRKERIVPFGKRTERALLEYLLMRTDKLPNLWVTEERHPMTAGAFESLIQRLSKRAGVQGVKHGPHTFRHTAASMCQENGMPLEEIQHLLGHSSMETTRNYLGKMDSTAKMITAHRKASPVDNWFKGK